MMGNNILCMLYWHINAEVKDVFIEMDGPPSWILGAWMRRWYWWWDGISKGQKGAAGEAGGEERVVVVVWGGGVTEEDICNTNRLLSLPLTIGLEEHQDHVGPDK